MLRIHFTAEDLARTRFAAAPDPLWETVLSLHQLRARTGATAFGTWRRTVLPRLDGPLGGQVRMLTTVVPATGSFPDFLTPYTRPELAAGLSAIAATPTDRLRDDIRLLAAARSVPKWLGSIGTGNRDALMSLCAAVRDYHETALAPYWPRITATVLAERARRARPLLDGGMAALLSSFQPMMRWQYPVLEVEYPRDREVRLEGRGLLLIPSYFCWGTPVALVDPALPQVLVYPAQPDNPDGDRATPSLDQLLGRTRAAILAALDSGGSTGDLAARTAVSPATASEHLGVLRRAGLATSRRHRNTVAHTLTPLGEALIAEAG